MSSNGVMVRRFTIPALLVASTFAAPVIAFGQIGLPGQYPGQSPSQYPGQYPPGQGPGSGTGGGMRLPGQRRNSTTTTTKEEQVRTSTITGVLRRMSSSELIVQADDKRIVTVTLAKATTYAKAAGGSTKSSDFSPGDHITVDATQDDNGYYHAKTVTMVKQGNAEEQIAASAPVDASPVGDSAKSSRSSDGGDGPPRLRRGDSAGDPPQPDAPIPPDPDDAGPPKLRHGSPETPAGRPSLHADEVNGVTKAPPPPSTAGTRSTGDTTIDKAREAAFEFSQTLPSYLVKQFTTRYQTDGARASQTNWQAIDTVSADVVSEGGKETYKNILVNGKAPREAIEKTGTWSTGEFSSVLLDVFSPATDADFHNRRTSTIANRAAFRYDFSVDQENSHWHVYSSADSYLPEYGGAIWIDKETYRVLRIEMSARNMPRAFPLDAVESAVDYDFVLLGDKKFLLPVHSEALSCERGTRICSRNVIDFRNYKKYGADTSITFDPN
jgi:hypothetical protein